MTQERRLGFSLILVFLESPHSRLFPSSATAQEDKGSSADTIIKYDDVEKNVRDVILRRQLEARKASSDGLFVKDNDDFLKALSKNWHPEQFTDKALVCVLTNSEGQISSIEVPTNKGAQSAQLKELVESIRRTKFINSFGVFIHFDNGTAKQCKKLFEGMHPDDKMK